MSLLASDLLSPLKMAQKAARFSFLGLQKDKSLMYRFVPIPNMWAFIHRYLGTVDYLRNIGANSRKKKLIALKFVDDGNGISKFH